MGAILQTAGFRDAKGMTASVRWWVDTGTLTTAQQTSTASGQANSLAALSNAAWITAHGPYSINAAAVTYGGTGQFQDIEDKAVMAFSDAVGTIHRWMVPAPLAAIFLADLETVDVANALVKQFIADWLNTTFSGTAKTAGVASAVVSRSDQLMTAFLAGTRVRRHEHRRFNSITKNPALTGPGL